MRYNYDLENKSEIIGFFPLVFFMCDFKRVIDTLLLGIQHRNKNQLSKWCGDGKRGHVCVVMFCNFQCTLERNSHTANECWNTRVHICKSLNN